MKAEALKAVDEYISSSEFKNSLSEILSFVSGEVKDSIKAAKDKITILEAVKSELQYKIDDLEQYTRRTNIRIYGIPESTSASEYGEDTSQLAMIYVPMNWESTYPVMTSAALIV